MRKITAHFLFIASILALYSHQTVWADTVQMAKTIEIETIIQKNKKQVELAEKELNYTLLNQARIREKHISDYREIVAHSLETLETALVDIGEINNSIDDFLGITYPHTRPDGVGNLDITALSRTASHIGDSESFRESFYELYEEKSDKLNIELWNIGMNAISSGLKALNSTLYIIQESVEDQIHNPDLILEDEKTKYKAYRDDIIGYIEILRENKSTIQNMDDEE